MSSVRQIFDDYATNYDADFTNTWLGHYYRKRVQRHMQKQWTTGKSIVELNSGTGEDAIFLAEKGNRVLATDMSSNMLRVAQSKLSDDRIAKNITFKQMDINHMDVLTEQTFDGLLSNFGGLNCVEDMDRFANNTSLAVRQDGIAILCLMGRYVPWEWIWFLLKGQPAKSFRRLSGVTEWRGSKIYYPRLKHVIKTMEKVGFRLVDREALGICMPPSYVSKTVDRWPRLFNFLKVLEERISGLNISLHLADHYILIFRRT